MGGEIKDKNFSSHMQDIKPMLACKTNDYTT